MISYTPELLSSLLRARAGPKLHYHEGVLARCLRTVHRVAARVGLTVSCLRLLRAQVLRSCLAS